jgi:hypothetical protein
VSARVRLRVPALVIAFVASGFAALSAACGSGGDTATGSFSVDFPTTDAAIAAMKTTPGVQVFVYALDKTQPAGTCQGLVEQSTTKNVTATPVAMTAVLTPCELLDGKGSLPVSYGSYAFLAVAQSSPGVDFLVGCEEQTISATNTVVSIPLTLAGSTESVPATKCTTLSQACSGGDC